MKLSTTLFLIALGGLAFTFLGALGSLGVALTVDLGCTQKFGNTVAWARNASIFVTGMGGVVALFVTFLGSLAKSEENRESRW